MMDSLAGPTAGDTTLLFQAPPALPQDSEGDEGSCDELPPGHGQGGGRTRNTSGSSSLRMLKGAREAVAGMHISDAQLQAVLEDPQDVEPDPKQPTRTRLRRDGLVVTTGNDGMILRVARRR
jgi:hypothetical protein